MGRAASVVDTADRSVSSVQRLFTSDLVQVGTLHHPRGSAEWQGEHDTGPGLSLGFPQRAMEYQRDRHDWVVGSPNSVFLNNPHSRYQRRRLHPRGEYTEWFRFDLAAARDVVARHAPRAADRCDEILPLPVTPRETRVFQVQRLLHTYLEALPSFPGSPPEWHQGLDPLFVEETAFGLLELVVARAMADVGTEGRRAWVGGGGLEGREPMSAGRIFAGADPEASPVSTKSGRRGSRNGRPPGSARRRAHRAAANEAARFVAAHFTRTISVAEVARAANVSRPTLYRAFRAHTGMTLHRYLTSLRLRQAHIRLGQAQGSVAGLAAELGFASHAHLTTAFRAEFGLTPSALRAESTIERVRSRIEVELEAAGLPSAAGSRRPDGAS